MHLMQHLFHLIYINKHLSRLTYGRAPAKGSNTIITRCIYCPTLNHSYFYLYRVLYIFGLILKDNYLIQYYFYPQFTNFHSSSKTYGYMLHVIIPSIIVLL